MSLNRALFCLGNLIALTQCSHSTTTINPADYQIGAALWHQTSAEYRALSYQAYNLARYRLDAALKKSRTKPAAVVVDIDQTILDGTPYQAELVQSQGTYPTGWQQYVDRADGEDLPGALGFLKYADKRGVRVFYLTNRKETLRDSTHRNLIARGFPQLDRAGSLILQASGDSKEAHRSAIRANFDVVLLMGDNLGDFDTSFDDKAIADRKQSVDESQTLFGSKYIVLPNAMYGTWEGAVYGYNWKLDPEQRNLKRRSLLQAPTRQVE